MATTNGGTPTGGRANWNLLQLCEGSTLRGTNQVTEGSSVPTGDIVFGGPSNKMGFTSISDTVVRSSDFGFAIRFQTPSGGGRIGIDYVAVTVYYTTPTGDTGSITIPVAVYGNPCVRYGYAY